MLGVLIEVTDAKTTVARENDAGLVEHSLSRARENALVQFMYERLDLTRKGERSGRDTLFKHEYSRDVFYAATIALYSRIPAIVATLTTSLLSRARARSRGD